MSRSWLMSELDGLLRLQSDLDRALERPFDWFARSTVGTGAFPPVNIFRSDDGYVVRMEAPGLTPNDFGLEGKGDTLNISGKRQTDSSKGTLHRHERWQGEFSRAVRLPKDAALESAQADYSNGVLSVRVPFREEVKPRQISITTGGN